MFSYILKINSRESNYKVTTNPIQVSYNNTGNSSLIQKIVVKGASIPNVFYNITNSSNKLAFSTDLDIFYLTFPVGNYTINSLMTYFNSSYQSGMSQVTLSFNTFLNKLEINSPASTGVFISSDSTMFHIIGLKAGNDFAFINGLTTMLYMPDLSGIRNIYAETSFSNMNCLDSKGHKSYGAFIPVDQPFGSVIHYINQEQDLNDIYRSKMYSQNLSTIEIGLRDVEGNLLDLQNMNWEITFRVVTAHNHDLVDE